MCDGTKTGTNPACNILSIFPELTAATSPTKPKSIGLAGLLLASTLLASAPDNPIAISRLQIRLPQYFC